jgi:hypothetical protein
MPSGSTALKNAVEPAPEHLRVVAAVVVGRDRLAASVAPVQGRYTTAFPVVLSRVRRRATPQELPLDFASRLRRPPSEHAALCAGANLDNRRFCSNIHTV